MSSISPAAFRQQTAGLLGQPNGGVPAFMQTWINMTKVDPKQ